MQYRNFVKVWHRPINMLHFKTGGLHTHIRTHTCLLRKSISLNLCWLFLETSYVYNYIHSYRVTVIPGTPEPCQCLLHLHGYITYMQLYVMQLRTYILGNQLNFVRSHYTVWYANNFNVYVYTDINFNFIATCEHMKYFSHSGTSAFMYFAIYVCSQHIQRNLLRSC